MIVGYARTSTLDQSAGFGAQLRDLTASGVEKIFQEQISSVAYREQLAAALDFVRDGDVFVVTKLDRLARSIGHLSQIVETLEIKRVTLRVLSIGLDTSTPTGRLMLNMLGCVAQFERELMLERQREGIAAARAKGLYKGRKPTAMAQASEVRRLTSEGLTREAVAAKLEIGVASVYRALKASKA